MLSNLADWTTLGNVGHTYALAGYAGGAGIGEKRVAGTGMQGRPPVDGIYTGAGWGKIGHRSFFNRVGVVACYCCNKVRRVGAG